MPASLYRLANKPHHSEVPAQAENVQEAVEPAVEQTQVTATELVNEQPTEGKETVVNDVSEPEVVDQQSSETTVSRPVWESSWTRSQLFQVANSLGLPVTSTSTKSEIIALLTALDKS